MADEVPACEIKVPDLSQHLFSVYRPEVLLLGDVGGESKSDLTFDDRLQTGDIDFNGKYLVVSRSIDRVHRKVVPTKTKRIRRVDLYDELIAVLKDHVRQQKESWLKREIPEGEIRKPQLEWLFASEEGSWLDMSNLAHWHFK